MNIPRHREFIQRYGVGLWCFDCLYFAAERAIGFKALRGMTLVPENADPKYLAQHARFSCRRNSAEDFAALQGAMNLESEQFYQDAADRGDWCYYLCDDETIASYGWYSTLEVPVVDNCSISFSSDFVYMYNGFTVPGYRGQQLHAYGMAHALEGAVADGYQGLISYVEANNAGSLRSAARLGYRTFGMCFRIHVLGTTVRAGSPGCKPYDFHLVRSESQVRPSLPTYVRHGARKELE